MREISGRSDSGIEIVNLALDISLAVWYFLTMAQQIRFTEYVTPERTMRLFTGKTIRYRISLDLHNIENLVRKALGNKARRAIDGPVKIVITQEPL